MLGVKSLSHNRWELYASQCPLSVLKPFLLSHYPNAIATLVLYEDFREVYHETGIFSFDASEPETFNYQDFQAPLIEQFHHRIALCTVENLLLHFERRMAQDPLRDDPFHNLLVSISWQAPPRPQLIEWASSIDKHLKETLWDKDSPNHFLLFPDEVCVLYSQDNYFTSMTSNQDSLIKALFNDVMSYKLLGPYDRMNQKTGPLPVLSADLMDALYDHVKDVGCIHLHNERLYRHQGKDYWLITYPQSEQPIQNDTTKHAVSHIRLNDQHLPEALEPMVPLSQWAYHSRYTDWFWFPVAMVLVLMLLTIIAIFVLPPSFTNPSL